MMLPTNKADLTALAISLKETCRASAAQRAALARVQNLWIQMGAGNSRKALINKLYAHNDRVASHLFSPAELRFVLDFEAHYPQTILNKAEATGRVLTRTWERKDIDMTFGAGVGVSLDYGAAILKQKWGDAGVDAHLLMPWQFGVYNEGLNSLDEQECLCESGTMTVHEVWRRISHLPNAEKLYRDILAHANKDSGDDVQNSFFHQVLSTSTLDTSLSNTRNQPGGIVQLTSDPTAGIVGPMVTADMVQYHELWVKSEAMQDYVTILMIEPGILISPLFKHENQFAPKTQPYNLIQANHVPGYLWGRSEIMDLMEPQGLIATWLEDIKRVMGLQYDKLLAFAGVEGVTDEMYDNFRESGHISLGAGGSVEDLTPKLPAEAFTALEVLNRAMDDISGFGNILSGQGEPGVRAGNQAETMVKMASPRLRDRSLRVERQCAAAADKTLKLLQAKDESVYWSNPDDGEPAEFLLDDLPDDTRVTVDSHSSSPIFADDHKDLVGFGLKNGFVDGHSAIEMLPYPSKDNLKQRLKKKQEQQAALLKQAESNPELAKILSHGKK